MEALESVQLADVVDKRVATYSRGMRQRLGIAEIVMKKAEVAILDEPTSGLDPHATFELLEMIRGLKRTGVAVLLSSHLLDRVQSVCDRVALFNKGKIALMGTVVELANQVLGAGHPILVEAIGHRHRRSLRGIEGVQQVMPAGEGRLAGRGRSRRARGGGAAHRLGRRRADAARRPAAQPRGGLHALLRGGAPCSVAARREGSPFTGLGPVFMKEFSDHLSSARMLVLMLFVIVFGAFPVASSLQTLRDGRRSPTPSSSCASSPRAASRCRSPSSRR